MREHRPSHALFVLTGGVLLAGTLLLPWGTRDVQSKADAKPPQHLPMFASMAINSTPEHVEHGAFVQTMECAGCHDGDRREIGPSFRDIAQLYQGRPAELAEAISHPQPGWADYPPGPERLRFSEEDRASLVSWILQSGGKGDD